MTDSYVPLALAPAVVDDLAAFVALESDAEARQFVRGESLGEHRGNFVQPDLRYVRIETNEALVGFFLLALDADEHSVEFRRVVVGPRGQGIGQRAVTALDDYVRALGRKRIWLDVFDDNRRGIHVYEKLGYTHFGQELYAGRTLLKYEKWLGE